MAEGMRLYKALWTFEEKLRRQLDWLQPQFERRHDRIQHFNQQLDRVDQHFDQLLDSFAKVAANDLAKEHAICAVVFDSDSTTTTSAATVREDSMELTMAEGITSQVELLVSEDQLQFCAEVGVDDSQMFDKCPYETTRREIGDDHPINEFLAWEFEYQSQRVVLRGVTFDVAKVLHESKIRKLLWNPPQVASESSCTLTGSSEGEKYEPEVFAMASEVMPEHFGWTLLKVRILKKRQSCRNWAAVATGFKGGSV